jgi:protein-disulfide isomerase
MVIAPVALLAQGQPQKAPAKAAASPTSANSVIERRIEAYLRKLYAWGAAIHLKVGPLRDAPILGFYEVPVEVSRGEESDSAVLYVSKDARFMLRGDLLDMNADPFAEIRSHISLMDRPSRGPANARVTLVEYADFQCPSCKQLHETLRAILPNYPQVRVIFKNFPLSQIHPWAMTAAIAGRCAFLHSSDAFWKLHDAIFDSQDLLTPENVWDRLLEFAAQAGLQPDSFRACMASPEAKKAIEASIADGEALKILSTPTVFVNGRAIVGGSPDLLDQFITYELSVHSPSPHVPNSSSTLPP